MSKGFNSSLDVVNCQRFLRLYTMIIRRSLLERQLTLQSRRYYSSVETVVTLPSGLKYRQPIGLFIANGFDVSTDGKKLTTYDPRSGRPIASVFSAGSADVNNAVQSARLALGPWRTTPGTERGILLHNLSRLIEDHKDILGSIEAFDTGKSADTAMSEDIQECINVTRYYAGWADKIHGYSIQPFTEKFAYTLHEPFGVCALIVPWNYPLMLAIWKLAPAVAAGNTVVLKTSELTPLSSLYLGNLITEAGFPQGVVNILSGDGDTGAALALHCGISKISFTGSAATGRKIMQAAASNLVPVTLELGGKSAAIIFEDADLEQAVKWCYSGIMSNSGQMCSATSRILIQETIYKKFVEMFKSYTIHRMSMGPLDHGPQISDAQLKKVLQYVRLGIEEGANLVYGGEEMDVPGYFMLPTIFSDARDHMKIVQEEVFGPVVVMDSFATSSDAIRRANSSEYGLASAVFTKSITEAVNTAQKLDVGMVWVNSSQDSDFRVPFGGFKMSGFGQELGEYAMKNYWRPKAVHLNLGISL
ncbi:aldehyde dehydrogenase domain-containing protein [Lipomyces tetrasporus]|uniref:Aldehyde dehydrogenase domain-containing protein n=1 Tax=Lipomyces tetrasporus TaxID=54092 RepID=A0AAD7QYY4_9ASCO|nr:aldehyde dehydrogenase domain-containing protein [Lipomyces tetrasporus]KAJ8103566.1 aldehyde dehydrogenase domain-containing protein [Lipomyces tetrasporus]